MGIQGALSHHRVIALRLNRHILKVVRRFVVEKEQDQDPNPKKTKRSRWLWPMGLLATGMAGAARLCCAGAGTAR